jgi:hypothetical protein
MTAPQSSLELGQWTLGHVGSVISEYQLDSPEMPTHIRDLARDFQAEIADEVGVGDRCRADSADFRRKADLFPIEGRLRLQNEITTEAESRAAQADVRAGRLLDEMRSALIDGAQPQPILDPGREMLIRDEIKTVFAGGGPQAILHLASSDRRDLVSALVYGGWAKNYVMSQGTGEREAADLIHGARVIAARSAVEHGGSLSEILSAKGLDAVDKLGAARGGAGTYVRGAIREARRA